MGDLQIKVACGKAIVALSEGDMDALSDIFDCMARMIFSVAYGINPTVKEGYAHFNLTFAPLEAKLIMRYKEN